MAENTSSGGIAATRDVPPLPGRSPAAWEWLRGPGAADLLCAYSRSFGGDWMDDESRTELADIIRDAFWFAVSAFLPLLEALDMDLDQCVATCAESVREVAVDLYDWQPVRRSVAPRTRTIVFRRDGYVCVDCGQDDVFKLTVDHRTPVHLGGGNDPENLITRCRSCNSSKGTTLR